MTVQVSTPVFTGPFDLLLHLITGNQVEIYEISLSDIVDQFLAELEAMEEVDLETATEFLVIAATLAELKSQRLLPDDEADSIARETEIGERRDFLIAKLLENQTFKRVAERLREMMEQGGRRYPRCVGPEERFAGVMPPLLKKVTPEDLARLAASALARQPVGSEEPDLSHIYVPPIRFAEVFDSVVERLQDVRQITFRDLTGGCRTRLEVGLHFLALLELYKRDLVDLEQFRTFGEITIHWKGPSDPTAEALLVWVEETSGQETSEEV